MIGITSKLIGAGVVILILVAVVGWHFLDDSGKNATTITNSPSTKEFVLKVQGKKIVEGSETLSVKQGDSVVIKVTSDEEEEFHVHGYDRSVDLEPGVEAILSFTADASGRFPFELENNKTDIGALEVLPQ